MSDPNDPDDRRPPARRPYGPAGGGNLSTSLDPRLAGVLFGVFAAALNAAGFSGLPLLGGAPLFAALPVFYVGFARGPLAAGIAAAVAVVVTALLLNPVLGLGLAAFTVVPAAYGAYLVNLARPADELGGPSDGMAWYPLADVLLRLCLTMALGIVALGVAFGYDPALVADESGAALTEIAAQVDLASENGAALDALLGGALSDEANREALAASAAASIPFFFAFIAALILVANLHLSMRLARARGVLARPADDMPLALRLPTVALPVFGAAVALAFLDGPAGLVARVVAGALGAAFMIAGFAIVHLKLRGSPVKPLLLVALYAATFLFALPAFVMLGFGLFSTARAVPISKRT